tara:strand:- start:1080 stop:1553 length:474 start_codon:yes stop_codon:yes gene_type:complete
MSVRIVRTRNGEDIICDLYEVTTKKDPETPVAFQLSNPYNVWLEGLDEPRLLVETEVGEGVQKISDPEIHFRPWVPLSSSKKILLKMEEVVTAYETYDEVINKYNDLVEADKDGGGDGTGTTRVPDGTNGVGDAPTTNKGNLTEESAGVSDGEGDGA